MVRMSDACAGENVGPPAHPPGVVGGAAKGVAAALGFCNLCTCGVVKTASSFSSPPMLASPSLSLLSLSLASIFTLPTELLTALRSGTIDAQPMFGESSIMLLILPLRTFKLLLFGIIMPIPMPIPFCMITGLESGELCSASVL